VAAIAVAAKLRAAGPHQKTVSGTRQIQKRALKKILGEPEGR
jgi:hypothetical protein